MPGAQCTRSLVRKNRKHTSIVTTVAPESPGIPARSGFTGSFALSPVIGYSIHTSRKSTQKQ
jgi:hypothetical protein